MDDKLEAMNGNGTKTLRDRFPICCDVCLQRIGHGEPYYIVGIRSGAGDHGLAENVYKHRECVPQEA